MTSLSFTDNDVEMIIMTSHEARTSDIAYRLWEFMGRPAGRDLDCWHRAERWIAEDKNCCVTKITRGTLDGFFDQDIEAEDSVMIPNHDATSQNVSTKVTIRDFYKSILYSETMHRMLSNIYAPAAALIDNKGETRFFAGPVDIYLDISTKEFPNIVDIVCGELKGMLQRLIHQAARISADKISSTARIKRNGGTTIIRLSLYPVLEDRFNERLFLVCFSEEQAAEEENTTDKATPPVENAIIYAFEQKSAAHHGNS